MLLRGLQKGPPPDHRRTCVGRSPPFPNPGSCLSARVQSRLKRNALSVSLPNRAAQQHSTELYSAMPSTHSGVLEEGATSTQCATPTNASEVGDRSPDNQPSGNIFRVLASLTRCTAVDIGPGL